MATTAARQSVQSGAGANVSSFNDIDVANNLIVQGIIDTTTLKIGGVAVGAALAAAAAPHDLPLTGARLIADWTTIVATTPGSSLLGLSATPGSNLVGNAASNNTKNDKAQFIFSLPAWYVAGTPITIKIRAKTTALSTVSDKISVDSCKLISDGALGSDLNVTASQQMTAAFANYSFTVTPTSRVAGETFQLIVATVLIDTGGAVGANGAISKVQILLG